AMVCHGELARLRPAPRHLTQYYLLMSLGGVLGGLCNALIAPLVFNMVLEYPLALVAACLLKPVLRGPAPGRRWVDFAYPLLIGGLAALTLWVWVGSGLDMESLARWMGGDGPAVALRLGASLVPVGMCYACCRRPLRFGLGAAALLAAGLLCYDPQGLIQ